MDLLEKLPPANVCLELICPERLGAGHEHLPVCFYVGSLALDKPLGHQIAEPAVQEVVQLLFGLGLQLSVDRELL